MQTIRSLIRSDLLILDHANGKNHTFRNTLILEFLIAVSMIFFFSPLIAVIAALIAGPAFSTRLTNTDIKQHTAQYFALLPVTRREIVTSRFLLMCTAAVVCPLILYPAGLLSLRLRLWTYVTQEEDFIEMLAAGLSDFSAYSLFSVSFFIALFFGMTAFGTQFYRMFSTPIVYDSELGSYRAKMTPAAVLRTVFIIAGILAATILGMLILEGIIPVSGMLQALMQIFLLLAGAANGWALILTLMIAAACKLLYSYAASAIKYEESEL